MRRVKGEGLRLAGRIGRPRYARLNRGAVAAAALLVVVMSGAVARPATGSGLAQGPLPYGTGRWDSQHLGNHRALVRVGGSAAAVRVHIPWRRPDAQPQAKAVIVTDVDDVRIDNAVAIRVTQEAGDIAFEPTRGAGEYHVYFMPWHSEGRSNYPKVTYPGPEETADPDWRSAHGVDQAGLAAGLWQRLPPAEPRAIQAISEFHSFFPMQVIATAAETRALLDADPQAGYLLFPEDRRYPVRMRRNLPARWAAAGAKRAIAGDARPGEWYAYQIGVWAARSAIEDVDVQFSDIQRAAGGSIAASSQKCVTLGGTDWRGRSFSRVVAVPEGLVQPLWCGVQVPASALPGSYRGQVTVTPTGAPTTTLPVEIEVGGDVIAAAGDDEPWRHSRLRWLDSTIGLDDEVIAPYDPVGVDDRTISILGRTMTLGAAGLPSRITSFFTPEMTAIGQRGRPVLAAPVTFEIVAADGTTPTWSREPFTIQRRASGLATWSTGAAAGPVSLRLKGRAEFDGTAEFELALSTQTDIDLADVRLRIPVAVDAARYMMGMGRKGGQRPQRFDWSWNVEANQDGAWIGDVNAGLQFSLRDEHYERPLNTNFYQLKPLVMPRSWDNEGRGGCRMRETGNAFEVLCFGGPRRLLAGEPLRFDFKLLVTPFHTLHTDQQWSTRFYHRFRPLQEIAATGANTVNVHHATEINPYINYPFMRPAAMKAYIDEAHARGMRVKIYYTVRELSNIAPELYALASLGTEVLSDGPGGGYSWLQEHLDRGYIAGWFVPDLKDAAVVNSGTSRWHNYYLEGLDWLARNVGIDGLYIDDVAFDRTVMKRVRRILTARRPAPLIDLHSANQFNPRDGYANSANLYLEHFPYIDRLWFGEYFDYDSAPDFWLTEVSGIPFGLMGEMLQGGGNPWRGLVYGMTNRLPWSDNADPRPIWKAWDAFAMQGSQMIGYWVADAPVRTSDPRVLATSYLQPGRALVAVASWSEQPVDIELQVDWQRLGIDADEARIRALPIEGFQPQRAFALGASIPVQPGRGWLLTIDTAPRRRQ